MIPLLLIGDDKRKINKYIDNNFDKNNDLFYEMGPEGKEYSIAQIKEVIKQTKIYNPKKRIYYFPDFYLSSPEAQNAFLKSLEESPDNVQFILTVNHTSQLLPTITSRTKIIKIKTEKNIKLTPVFEKELEDLIFKKNLKILTSESFNKTSHEDGLKVVEQIIFFFQKRLDEDKKAATILKETLKLKSLLENNNLNPQLTIDRILIFIAKTYTMKSGD